MDNSTYDVLNLPPINTNDTYSTLEYEAKRNEDIIGHGMKHVEQNTSNGTTNKKKNKQLRVVIIIMMVILLLISIASLALSAAAYNQSKPEQSTVQNQQSKADNDITVAQTQLDTTCSNISQMIFQVDTNIKELTSLLLRNTDMEPQSNCGPGLWYPVAHLNMSDPSQQCPFAWREYNTNGVRACGRPTNSSGSCAAIRHFTDRQYRRVCGRVTGYQFATPDAFRHVENSNSIDLDGINITHGINHSHIWSYVAGYRNSSQHTSNCPCFNNNEQGTNPPLSAGDNYYCESGNPDNNARAILYTDDPLWDGQQCEGTCCTGTNFPPWFTVQLPAPTIDAIEVSICCDQGTDDEDVPVELIEIYVQ